MKLTAPDPVKTMLSKNSGIFSRIRCIGIIWCSFLYAISTVGQNAIVLENSRPGNPASEWQIDGAGDRSIQGFATEISYNRGEIARFKIKTNAAAYSIRIYRLGYYQGLGARFQGNAAVTANLPQAQPLCITEYETGLLDCGNWAESGSWQIPADAVSGIYIAKLTRQDTGGSSHIAFIVRDDTGNSELLFQTSDATWQAYNVYGDNNNGKSLYTGAGGKAVKVSYNRPFITRNGGGGGDSFEDWLFNAEYPMIRWLEANGYDVSYTTNVDSDRRGHLIKNHKVFLSVGHDEYWSATHRKNVTEARDAGIHLAFFSGNEVYWKTRREKSIDGEEISYRTLVCYKEGIEGENVCSGKCDPTPEWTGLWRSGCEYMTGDILLDGCRPENELTGQISWDWSQASMGVPADYKDLRFWRNTNVASLEEGEKVTMPFGTIGFEWNPEQEEFRSSYPKGRIILSRTEIDGKVHHASLYRHTSNALIFGAGTVQWSWGLDSNHDRSGSPSNPDMQQATLNLLADMGVQPGSIRPGLIPTTASTDETPPVTSILLPAEDSIIPVSKVFTISGTALDDYTVAGVEISLNNGLSWRPVMVSDTWNYSWTPRSGGEITVMARAFDDSGNIGAADTVNLFITASGSNDCPCTVFTPDERPTGPLWSDGSALQLGMKFRSSVDGFISGVRFYKEPGNTGVHTGQLYSRSGNLLAEAVFTNETSSGWQEVTFPSPVAITAATTYVISYHSSSGHYSADNPYFSNAVENGLLTGLETGADGVNGVYRYTTTPSFPNLNYQSSNYWVDVVFNTTGNVNLPPEVTLTSPAANSSLKAPATILLEASASDPDGSVSKVEFFTGSTRLGEDTTAPYSYNWENLSAGNYPITARATDDKGKATTSAEVKVDVTSESGNLVCPCTIFEPGDTPTGGLWGGNALQLGMKFRSSQDGFITGARFFKEAGNTGIHTAQLYSRNGDLLAEAVYLNETTSGWQEVSFASPVPVTANSTYVISYHSNSGFYSLDTNYFNSQAVLKEPLTGLQSGTDGSNGVYRYSATPTFPNLTYQSSNYWVDVVYNTTTNGNLSPNVSLVSPADNSSFEAPATILLEALASDPDGSVTKVEFFQGTTRVGEDTTAPYTYSWENVQTGNITLTAEATDNLGVKSIASAVNITITEPAGNVLPTVSIGEDRILILPENTVTLTAIANDVDGTIASYLWEQVSGPEIQLSAASQSLYLNELQEGIYVLKVTVTDNDGGIASDEMRLTVQEAGNLPPFVSISSPLTNEIFTAPIDILIQADTEDSDGTINKVEFFAGTVKLGEVITAPFSYTWENVGEGTYSLTARATDDKGAQTTSSEISIAVKAVDNGYNCPCTLFGDQDISTTVLENDGAGGLQLGMKFQSQVDGFITGARFYKQNGNTGLHIGQLYDRNGNLLAEADFQDETTSGWQQVAFASPVAINAGTTYVISYHSSEGYYSVNDLYFSSPVLNEPLEALLDGAEGGNGVYRYTSSPAFPSFSYNRSNYWVDVVFETSLPLSDSTNAVYKSHLSSAESMTVNLIDRIQVIPNPFSSTAILVYQLQKEGEYSISLHDARGSLVGILKNAAFAVAGEEYRMEIDGTLLSQGIYFLRIEHQNEVKTIRLIIKR